jgi:hypothetical protein
MKLNLSILRETKTNQKMNLNFFLIKFYFIIIYFVFIFLGKEKEYINTLMDHTMKEITKMIKSKN